MQVQVQVQVHEQLHQQLQPLYLFGFSYSVLATLQSLAADAFLAVALPWYH